MQNWPLVVFGRQRQVDLYAVNSRPAWSTEQGPGQPGLHRPCLENKQTNKSFLNGLKCAQKNSNGPFNYYSSSSGQGNKD